MSGLDLPGLLVFAGALLVAAASPGPAIVALVARVLGRGREGAFAFAAGLALGDVVWLTVAVLGLAVIAGTFHEIFLVIRYVGAAYLLYLAWKLWTAPAKAPEVTANLARESTPRLFLGGLALTMGNPKVMVFYLALLPSLVDLLRVDALAYAELALAVCAILAIVFAAYI
ncbi:MAG: LysE family translocator, partial [Bauldia sp.]